MTNRLFRIFSTLIIVTVLLSACSGTETIKEPLNVAWTVWPGEYPHLIAQDKGFFEKRGLTVNLILYDSQSTELADLQSGKIDAGVFSLTDTMALAAEKPDGFRVILAVDSSNGSDAIVATTQVASVADLKGKHIAANMGSQTEFFTRYALNANGISAGDVFFEDMDPENVPGALGKQVDAGHTWDPYLSEAVDAGYHVIYSSADTPGLLTDVLIFKKSLIDERPDDIHAYIAAWFEALEYWQANPEESNSIIAKYTGLQADEISAEDIKLFTLADNLTAFQAGDTTKSLHYTAQLNLDFLATIGAINAMPDLNQVLDPNFIQ